MSLVADASLELDRNITYFDANKLPRQDILVTNPDKETLFLETEVLQVINPGTHKEERVKITDPDQVKLLVTPDKSIIPSGGRKNVRLLHLGKPPIIEEVYRVNFKPVVGKLHAKESGVKILVAYQVLVFIQPERPFIDLSGKREGNKMTFTNNGNINVLLRNGRHCPAGLSPKASETQKVKQCKNLKESYRIYAGEKWTMTLPENTNPKKGFIEYGLFDGKKEIVRQFTL